MLQDIGSERVRHRRRGQIATHYRVVTNNCLVHVGSRSAVIACSRYTMHLEKQLKYVVSHVVSSLFQVLMSAGRFARAAAAVDHEKLRWASTARLMVHLLHSQGR